MEKAEREVAELIAFNITGNHSGGLLWVIMVGYYG